MGNTYKEKGGGPATALASDLVGMFQSGLNTGSFGSRSPAGGGAMTDTIGMTGVLNDLLAGGAGHIGGSLMDMISKDTERQVNASRARYSLGGTGYGTPGMMAESMIRSEQAPKLTSAIGQLQLSALLPILQMMSGLAGKGIAQREGTVSPSPLGQIAALGLPLIGSIMGGPAGGAIGSGIGSLFGMGGGGGPMNARSNGFSSALDNPISSSFTMPLPQLFNFGNITS